MLKAQKFLGCIGIGVTRPLMIEADDKNKYIVKLKNNRLGTKVLVNEYIANWFSKRIDLCFPSGEIIELPESFINNYSKLKRMHIKPGLHFASLYINNAKYVHRYNIEFIKNKPKIAGVMLFDHLMHNPDRTLNGKNMLITKEQNGYNFYAIDNSHLFGSGRWQKERLENLVDKVKVNHHRIYGTLLRHYLQKDDFTLYVEQFKAITKEQIEEMVSGIPIEWLQKEEEREAIKTFLIKRLQSADLVANKIIDTIDLSCKNK